MPSHKAKEVFVENGYIPLRQVLAKLHGKHGNRAPRYQAIWTAAVEARIPAVKDGPFWAVREADLALVEQAFGLPSDQKTTAPRRRQPTAA